MGFKCFRPKRRTGNTHLSTAIPRTDRIKWKTGQYTPTVMKKEICGVSSMRGRRGNETAKPPRMWSVARATEVRSVVCIISDPQPRVSWFDAYCKQVVPALAREQPPCRFPPYRPGNTGLISKRIKRRTMQIDAENHKHLINPLALNGIAFCRWRK